MPHVWTVEYNKNLFCIVNLQNEKCFELFHLSRSCGMKNFPGVNTETDLDSIEMWIDMHFRKLQKHENSFKFLHDKLWKVSNSVEFPLTTTKAFRPHMWDFFVYFFIISVDVFTCSSWMQFLYLYKFILNEKNFWFEFKISFNFLTSPADVVCHASILLLIGLKWSLTILRVSHFLRHFDCDLIKLDSTSNDTIKSLSFKVFAELFVLFIENKIIKKVHKVLSICFK